MIRSDTTSVPRHCFSGSTQGPADILTCGPPDPFKAITQNTFQHDPMSAGHVTITCGGLVLHFAFKRSNSKQANIFEDSVIEHGSRKVCPQKKCDTKLWW